MFDSASNPHRRYNPLSREWVLVSPHRTQRPWQGQVEPSVQEQRPAYDPTCYLCPRNERAGGKRNPEYEQTFVFTNDFAALLPDGPDDVDDSDPLLHVQCVPRAEQHPPDKTRPDLREPRSDDGGEQPSPSRANLGDRARSAPCRA